MDMVSALCPSILAGVAIPLAFVVASLGKFRAFGDLAARREGRCSAQRHIGGTGGVHSRCRPGRFVKLPPVDEAAHGPAAVAGGPCGGLKKKA
jgi:hypothetical protein